MNQKNLTEMTIAELDAIGSLDEVLELEHREAKVLSDELIGLNDKPMTSAERLERRREINDKTRQIHKVVHVWRKMHRGEDAGPPLEISAAKQDSTINANE